MDEKIVYSAEDVEENKVIALLSYLGILVLVPLLAKKESPYAQFHAKQGLVLLITWIAIGIITVVPIIGWIIGPIASIVLLIFCIIGIINALGGQAKELPLIGQFGEKFNL